MSRIGYSVGVLVLAGLTLAGGASVPPQSDSEKAIVKQMSGLRKMPDSDRAVATKSLALAIRRLPTGELKADLANGLANLATEGDFGRDTLQEVTTTLALALAETPRPSQNGQLYPGYDELAQLAKYEHMKVALSSPDLTTAVKNLNELDEARKRVDFTLADIEGHGWTLSALKGKVVLVNFWATWCPPCRKEMPDLQTLYDRFKSQGFVILSISDETAAKVNPFIADHKYTWPILLDPGRKVNEMYRIQGIPKSFLYNRKGQLIEQTIDMRTQAQFLTLLAKAGLR
jgi:peroxiredoxin